jgi:hypothetical protein
VFAEAVMGSCNSCEDIDDSKFWRWEESPIDEPPSIDPISMATRRVEPTSLTPTAFPTPIVSIQNAPAAPDPIGLKAALDAIARQSFTDITGLAATQANAAAAYAKALDTALAFGKEASTLAQQAAMVKSKDKVLDTIDKSEEQGKIKHSDAEKHRNDVIDRMTMTPPPMVEATGDPDEWAPWPSNTTPPPAPPTPIGVPPPPRPKPPVKAPNSFDVAIKFRVFVPAQIWSPFVGSPLCFNGDNRSFDPTIRSSRAEAEVKFRLDATTFTVSEKSEPTYDFGPARLYLPTSSHQVTGKPPWWREADNPNAAPVTQKKMARDEGNFYVTVEPSQNVIVVRFFLRAQPYFPWEEVPQALEIPVFSNIVAFLEDVANPDFDADITVTIVNMGDGAPRYLVAGKHNRFPAYEIYVNGHEAYASRSNNLDNVVDVSGALNSDMDVDMFNFQLLKKPN